MDVSDPAAPREVGVYDTAGSACSVALAGGLIYVGDGLGGLVILRYAPEATPTPTLVSTPTPTATSTRAFLYLHLPLILRQLAP